MHDDGLPLLLRLDDFQVGSTQFESGGSLRRRVVLRVEARVSSGLSEGVEAVEAHRLRCVLWIDDWEEFMFALALEIARVLLDDLDNEEISDLGDGMGHCRSGLRVRPHSLCKFDWTFRFWQGLQQHSCDGTVPRWDDFECH